MIWPLPIWGMHSLYNSPFHTSLTLTHYTHSHSLSATHKQAGLLPSLGFSFPYPIPPFLPLCLFTYKSLSVNPSSVSVQSSALYFRLSPSLIPVSPSPNLLRSLFLALSHFGTISPPPPHKHTHPNPRHPSSFLPQVSQDWGRSNLDCLAIRVPWRWLSN